MPIIDVYLRLIVAYHIGTTCKASDLNFTLNNAISKYCQYVNQLIIRTDNGSQMISNIFANNIKKHKGIDLIHERIPIATPNKNAHIESFNSILEVEFLQVMFFENYSQAYSETVNFITHYNNERIHGSLKYKTPSEVFELYKKGISIDIKDISL